MEPLAEKYDEELKLSHKLKQKAKFIMGITKRNENFKKKKEAMDREKSKESNKDTNNQNEYLLLFI